MNQLKTICSLQSSRGTALVVLLTVLTGVRTPVHGQSPLGPAEAEGAVTLQSTGGFFLANFKAKNDQGKPVFQLGYLQRDDSKIGRLRSMQRDTFSKNENSPVVTAPIKGITLFGLELEAAPAGSAASLFASDRLSIGSRITLSLGLAYLASSLPSYKSRYESSLGRMLSLIEKEILTASEKVLRSHILDLETSFIPTLERLAARSEAGPEDDPFFREQLQRACRLRVGAQSRLAELQNAPTQQIASCGIANSSQRAASPTGAAETRADTAASNRKFRLPKPIYDALYIKVFGSASRYTLYDASQPFEQQFRTEDFRGLSIGPSYQANFGGRIPFIVAIAGGWGMRNNANELTEIEATDQRTITSPDGTTQRITTNKRKGLRGAYEETRVGTLRGDLVLYPDLLRASRDAANLRSTIALNLFGRARQGTRAIWGGGAYLTQPGDPLKVYGGLNIYRDTDKELAIEIVAGFPFGG